MFTCPDGATLVGSTKGVWVTRGCEQKDCQFCGCPPTGGCELPNAPTIADDMSFTLCTSVSIWLVVELANFEICSVCLEIC